MTVWRFPQPVAGPFFISPKHGYTTPTKPQIDEVDAETYPEAVRLIGEKWRREGVIKPALDDAPDEA